MSRLLPAAAQLRALARGAIARALAAALAAGSASRAWADPQAAPAAAQTQQTQQTQPRVLPEFYIHEYRVLGAHHLQPIEIEKAVYPFLGPGRTAQDVEQARAALQKVYEDKQYTSVDVTIPPQTGAGGIVFIKVDELTVGRLRVHGSRYYDIEHIKAAVPALAEGQLINFTNAQQQLVALNQLPDRRVTPVIQAGAVPGTVDVDLNVKDTLPLHGSIELNNRYSLDTPPLRLNGSLSYDNLWQLGHSIGGSIQVSPNNVDKVAVYSAFYTIRFPTVDWLTFTIQGSEQNSNVDTLGSINSVGRGKIIGLRTNFKLPTMGDYFQSFTFGIDYKDYTQDINVPPPAVFPFPYTPTTYVPVTLDYSGTWVEKNFLTELDLQLIFNLRGIGSSQYYFDLNRFGAQSNFIYFHGDLAHTQDLPHDFQVYGKLTGQVSDSPLVNSEEFSLGGLDTVRGYLESEVLGDDAIVGNFEFRTPSLLQYFRTPDPNAPKGANDWRFYFFTDAGATSLIDALPGQPERYSLASFGGGTRITVLNHFNGSLDLAIPLFSQTYTKAHVPVLTFRVWADF